MKKIILGAGFGFLLAIGFAGAEEPAVPQDPSKFTLPTEFPGMPRAIARQLKCDLAKVQNDVRNFQNGIYPPLPVPPDFLKEIPFPLPEIPFMPCPPRDKGNFKYRQETTWSCVDGQFDLRHELNDVRYRVTGGMVGGKAVPASIQVQESDQSTTYFTLGQVPMAHREVLRKLLDERGN